MTPELQYIFLVFAVMVAVRIFFAARVWILGILPTPGGGEKHAVRRENRISELEHDLELLPCSSDNCWSCHPGLDPQEGVTAIRGDIKFVYTRGLWYRVVS